MIPINAEVRYQVCHVTEDNKIIPITGNDLTLSQAKQIYYRTDVKPHSAVIIRTCAPNVEDNDQLVYKKPAIYLPSHSSLSNLSTKTPDEE